MRQATLRLHSVFIGRSAMAWDRDAAQEQVDWARRTFGLGAHILHLPQGILLTRGEPSPVDLLTAHGRPA